MDGKDVSKAVSLPHEAANAEVPRWLDNRNPETRRAATSPQMLEGTAGEEVVRREKGMQGRSASNRTLIGSDVRRVTW